MKNFSRSILSIFAYIIMFLVPIINTQAKEITTLDVTQSDEKIFVSGTAEAGTLAVARMIYDSTDTNLLTMQTTSVANDNTFKDSITIENGNYIVKVADYDGGDYMSKTVKKSEINSDSESKTDKNSETSQDNDSEIKSDIDLNNNHDTKSSEDENLKDSSKKEIKLISTDNENIQKSSVNVVQNMLKKIYNGEILSGINKELAQKIIKAIDNGEEISLKVGVSPLDEQKIANDVKKINEHISDGQNLINYYDISVQLDLGDEVANLTQLTDTITIKLPMPTNLPKLSNGYKRIFKILRIHDGKIEELSTITSDDEITFETNKFSTYALTYEDIYLAKQNDDDTLEDLNLKTNEINNISNPETGDNIQIFIFLTFISLLGIFVVSKIYKKSKVNN